MSRGNPKVAVVGGSVAAFEAILALQELAPGLCDVTLFCPDDAFVYAALSVGEPFGLGEAPRIEMDQMLDGLEAELVKDRVVRIDPQSRVLVTAGGDELNFDAVLVAAGAVPNETVPGALLYRGSRDAPAMRHLLEELERGDAKSVSFVIPAGMVWPLPLYELALMTSRRLSSEGAPARVSLVTAEQAPLRLFGKVASDEVTSLLARADVELHTSKNVEHWREGSLALIPNGVLPADRVVAAPRLTGRKIDGLPFDETGFLRTDGLGLVDRTDAVYAAGDITSFPVKQGGIATQQADAAASAIAASLGAAVEPVPFRPVLRGLMLSGDDPTYLRAKIAGGAGDSFDVSSAPLWASGDKVAGRYLSTHLMSRGLIPSKMVGA